MWVKCEVVAVHIRVIRRDFKFLAVKNLKNCQEESVLLKSIRASCACSKCAVTILTKWLVECGVLCANRAPSVKFESSIKI